MKEMFLRDFRFGIVHKAWKYLLALLCCIGLLLYVSAGAQTYAVYMGETLHPSAGDLFSVLFRGQPPYIMEQGHLFRVPYEWLLVGVFVFLIANHTTKDLEHTGTQVILQAGGRTRWIFSKYVFGLFSTLLFFLCALLSSLCMALVLQGTLSLALTENVVWLDPQMQVLHNDRLLLYLMPFVALLTIAVLQITVELMSNSIFACIVVIALLVTSVFFSTPFLPGNGILLLRSTIFDANGISPPVFFLSCSVLMLTCVLLGWRTFRGRDLL